MARYTPGPWSLRISGDGYHIGGTVAGSTARVCTVHGMKPNDAHLILQAPRLFELLTLARNELGGYVNIETIHGAELCDKIDEVLKHVVMGPPPAPKVAR